MMMVADDEKEGGPEGEDEVDDEGGDDNDEEMCLSPLEQSFSKSLLVHDLEHLDDFEGTIIPDQALNFNIPWRAPGDPDDEGEESYPDPALENFISNTSSEKFSHDAQVMLFIFNIL
jgi:hypothetical protein